MSKLQDTIRDLRNNSVTHVNLMKNLIGASGAMAIAEALKVNSSITSVDLHGNQIGDSGAMAIAEALKVNSSITSVDLHSNQIGNALLKTIGEYVTRNLHYEKKLKASLRAQEENEEAIKNYKDRITEKSREGKILFPNDFNMSIEISYKLDTSLMLERALFSEDKAFELGSSNNLLFFYGSDLDLQSINFDISNIFDSKGHNILHYAIVNHNLDLVSAILNKAKHDGVIGKLVNHRNNEGTNPIGMNFLFKYINDIEIAKIFAAIPEYQINSYLNNKAYMDYSMAREIGGTNLLHNVLLTASNVESKESKKALSDFFKVLMQRIVTQQDESFNPNYPTMNPAGLRGVKEGHMISTSKLIDTLKFSSNKIKQLCKKYFNSMLQIYEAEQFDDSSGDSEDEQSHACTYKQILLELDKFIESSLSKNLNKINNNFQRTFDRFSAEYSIMPTDMEKLVCTSNKYDPSKWASYWQELNSTISKEDFHNQEILYELYRISLNSMVVPLFHGVPFMHSQYTNHQRREVIKKISEINRKLIGRYDGTMTDEEYTLTLKEEILIGIHSRTSTATVGMQSLYEVITAKDEDLEKLDDIDNKLLKYFERDSPLPGGFKKAMQDYIFNFSASHIEKFWTNNCDGKLPDDTIVKYRFPIIATSKAPDHAIRFAIGRNVEGTTRGEIPMQPEYIDGQPTHRIAGLLYVTLHKLSDLVSDCTNHTMMDVNQSLKSGEIDPGRGAQTGRFMHQLECDFLGKLNSHRIVAVVPIIYPNVREEKDIQVSYHQAIYGINTENKKQAITSPTKIRQDTDANPNPSIINSEGNLSGFGKMMVPSVSALANGIVTAIAHSKNWFLCTIKDDNELIPYEVKSSQAGGRFSKAQQSLKSEDSPIDMNKLWRHIVEQPSYEPLEPASISTEDNFDEDMSSQVSGLSIEYS